MHRFKNPFKPYKPMVFVLHIILLRLSNVYECGKFCVSREQGGADRPVRTHRSLLLLFLNSP